MMSNAMDPACDERQAGIAVVRLGGEYGSANSQALVELEKCLLEEYENSSLGLLIDLDATVIIGCEFLSVLLRVSARVDLGNRRFCLCTLNSSSECVLVNTHLDSLWRVFRTRQEAIAFMEQPPVNDLSNDCSQLRRGGDVLSSGT